MSPGAAVGVSMNQGFLGNFARNADCIIVNRIIKPGASYAGPNFGDPVALLSGNLFQALPDFITVDSGSFTLANFAGVAVREVKTFVTYQPTPTIAGYLPGQPCDVIERGSVSVRCRVGTPTAGGAVYVRITLNGAIPAGIIGGFEAAADGGNTIALTNCEWATGAMDANGVVEMVIKTRNKA